MTMTANTLYEAVEPHALWRQLLKAAFVDIFGDTVSCEVHAHFCDTFALLTLCDKGINIVIHILTAYHTHDEEIETLHLPVTFVAILEVLSVSPNCVPSTP